MKINYYLELLWFDMVFEMLVKGYEFVRERYY